MATVDSLDIQITVSLNQASAALQRLNSQMDSVRANLQSIGLSANGNFSRLAGSAGNITANFKNVSKSITTNFKSVNKATNTLTSGLKRVTRQFVSLGAVIKSIKSSMDYIETLNYFDRAFEQVAESADLSKFAQMGYASAEEYFNSFSERAKELTSKMSGFNINLDGTLTASGLPSLGIDPNKLMNYQAMFAQMSSSMGVASETSLKLSNALSMIGADSVGKKHELR